MARMTRLDNIVGIEKISGIVTDRGINLCHEAIIARERSIPYVVGTKKATEFSIKNRSFISLDGLKGTVCRNQL